MNGALFSECCISQIIDNSQQIARNGIEVEIDESKFRKRKYYRGHKVEGQWVFGGREKYDKTKISMVTGSQSEAINFVNNNSEMDKARKHYSQ